ncbi:MAG TPA: class I SAM-dependent methyltransferase [Candidatus Saccharimonadales bacterium]|nr:class I SAM-dependent methyltransferase [Candidatus Saccharimonadales bacterium]
MKNTKKMTADDINKLSYTDFIGLVNQWNVLPGSYNTLNKWRVFSNMTNNSRILEIACTTGFSCRELAILTGCSGVGIDISEPSIKMAEYNKSLYAPNINMKYIAIDGYKYEASEKFSHIIFGAALRFFPDPQAMLKKSLTMLEDNGYILSSEFYINQAIPQKFVTEAREVFGINITQVPYKEVMKIYEGLEIFYEDKNELIQETEEEINYYTKSTIDRAVNMLNISNKDIYDAMYQRLFTIKNMSNKLRPYQRHNVLVLRYRSNIYPKRYTELF